jgi:uncharacterized DUF497 family protein
VEITGLLFDDANIAHIARHGITPADVEHAVLGGGYRRAGTSDAHRRGRVRVLGVTENGRAIVVFLDEPTSGGLAYVVTARPATAKERRSGEEKR